MNRMWPPTQVVHGGRRAAIGHMIELHAGHGLEQGGGEVRGGADALRAVGDGAGFGLGLRDQLLDRRDAELGIDDQHVGRAADDGDRLELGRVVVELLVERLVDGERGRRRGQQRVAVGVRAREGFRADVAGRAGAVLDHHRLLPDLAQRIADEARQRIGRSAGGIGDDDLDGLGGEALRRRRPAGHRQRDEDGGGQQ